MRVFMKLQIASFSRSWPSAGRVSLSKPSEGAHYIDGFSGHHRGRVHRTYSSV